VDITFRPLALRDLPMLHEWLARPHVAEWWGPPQTLAEIIEEFGGYIADPASVQPHIALLDGAPLGYIQSYVAMGSGDGWWEDERDPGVRGIDQFLANAEQLGRGLGTRMVRSFVEGLFEDPAVTRVQTDPSPANARAIRCYEKAGFRRVTEIETPDGRALLMHAERASLPTSTRDKES
jgi:AacA4 family aminoglycoside N(6')-acetyltransferase